MEIWDAGGTPMRGTLRYSLNPFYHYNCLTDINCLTALVGGDEVYDMWIALFNRYGYDGYDGLMDMIYDVDMGQTCQASTDLVDNFTIYHIDAVSTGAVAHENGHLVHESFWNIDQAIPNEPGVVHESFADLHDMWVDSLGTQDWGMEASAACGYPTFVRSYADPPNRDPSQVEYPTPDSYRWYERLNVGTDLGGVHVNVGILNKLAYLLLTTGTNFHHGRPVDGLPGIAEPIFFDAIEYGHYSWYSDIHDYRDGLVAACAVRYGADSYFCGQLENAWEAVGLWSNELSDPFANVGSRPATLSFPADVAPQDGVDDWWLYAFYKDSQSNRIMWRWGEPESNYWGYEKAVELGGHGGSNLYTEDPVALAIWQDKLYVFFRPAGSDSIYYFYMTKSETFYGPWRIKDTTPPVETDRGPAAVSSGQWLTVLYKVKGHQFTRVVRRPPPYGPWTVTAGIAPFWTNDAPFLTTASATVGTRTAVAAAAVRHTGYPSNGIKWAYYDDDVWFTQTGTQGSASVPVGFRQYADTPGDFDFSEPSTCDTPVLVEWGGDLVLAWCETGSPFIFHKVLGLSRGPLSETSGTRVWGPSVWIDQSASEVSPSLLVARNTVGFPVGLWAVFQEYEGDHLYWRESRGEQ